MAAQTRCAVTRLQIALISALKPSQLPKKRFSNTKKWPLILNVRACIVWYEHSFETL